MVSLHGIIQERFGVRVRSAANRETIAMTTASALVLRNDSSRLAAVVINLGGQAVFMVNSGVPSATFGLRIPGNGGALTLMLEEDFTLVGEEWFGITSVGVSTLYVLEILIEPPGEV